MSNITINATANCSIQITGTNLDMLTGAPTPFDVTYKIGEKAAYGCVSYFLLGTIEKITAKTVTFRALDGGAAKRISVTEFARQNAAYAQLG
tara:strand:+ start:6407 stop:6682 length:276 start_codon:yes stop_codon:yes gene_type:complete